jgi:hypothetical protein
MSEIDPTAADDAAAEAAASGVEPTLGQDAPALPDEPVLAEPPVVAEAPVPEVAGSVEPPAVAEPPLAEVAPVTAPTPIGQPSGRQIGKVRSPVGGWFLALITFGIYALVWYYKINKELRDYDSSIVVKPGLALLSLFVPIVGLVSIYNTGKRIQQAQTVAGITPEASGLLGLVLYFVFGLWLPYYNSNNNKVWRAEGATA